MLGDLQNNPNIPKRRKIYADLDMISEIERTLKAMINSIENRLNP
jgi:hypothetical protein